MNHIARPLPPAVLALAAGPGRITIAGAPEGQDARLVAALAEAAPAGVLHVALDDARAARLIEAMAFFAPAVEAVLLPAWDCLPYDRISPNAELVARRIEVLARLARPRRPDDPPLALVTTVNAVLQRVPTPAILESASLDLALGERVDLDLIRHFLAINGYRRTETVREPGEYALRGGIVDVYAPGSPEPLRLDLFGDELEQIRSFDAASQRTTARLERVTLRPAAEFLLDEGAIQRFRQGYRALFGAVTADDPLYEAVSAGRRMPGIEHWLPLFHVSMARVPDLLPTAPITLDARAEDAIGDRLEQVRDFYQARRELTLPGAEKRAGTPYKPVPPDQLYLTAEEWQALIDRRPIGVFSAFGPAEAASAGQAVDGGARRGRDFADSRQAPDVNVFDALRDHLKLLGADGRPVAIAAYSRGARDRLTTVLAEHGIHGLIQVEDAAGLAGLPAGAVGIAVLALEHGFAAGDLCLVTEADILGDRLARAPRRRRRNDRVILEAAGLSEGDLVVHLDHGIGQFSGLETLVVDKAAHDCLRILYDGGDKLYVPVENIDVLSRYGSDAAEAQLDRLGGAGWQARRARVRRRLMEMAGRLIQTAAERELNRAEILQDPGAAYQEFCARFPYTETDDQLNAIEDVLGDLARGRPMDRLVCGDVGFGKTEVALRAAFVAALAGQQVAVVVPTTLLARQHFQTFAERFRGLPVRIEQLSRLVSAKDTRRIKEELAQGTVDIIVGTHALLGAGVEFKALGLVIVDEEQHFGVKQKEKLKELRSAVHVLTLTATPIPRTLQLALAGVRELSLIATPPVDRLAVRTFVLPYDPLVVREALMREHFRGGQSFYVCPRVEDLAKLEEGLRELVPELKVVSAHGRMSATELEERMGAFYDGRYDILLATNIIESGLDIPRANTLVVHRADLFGLAQLYQLRGRVGRSKLRGYAYLTWASVHPLTATAEQRLHVIETLDSLGAGFQLASYDLDIRGAGNLLGEEQSGQVREVGIELYQQMLAEAIEAARRGLGQDAPAAEERWQPTINLGLSVMIPEDYVADLNLRLSLYRRVATLETEKEIDAFAAELVDRFGPLPEEVTNLLDTVTIKLLSRRAQVEKLDSGPKGIVIGFRPDGHPQPQRLVDWIARQGPALRLRPDGKLVYAREIDDAKARHQAARKLMRNLAALATPAA